MVDALRVLTGAQQVYFRGDSNTVLSDLCEAAWVQDVTNNNGSNTDSCMTLGFINHLWLDKFFPVAGDLIDTQQLFPGSNEFGSSIPIDNVEITLDLSEYQGDLTYGDMQYANYGVLSFIDDGNFQQAVQWVNFPKSVIYPVKQLVLGFRLFLKQGVKGTFSCYKQSSVPPLALYTNTHLNDFDPYHGKIL